MDAIDRDVTDLRGPEFQAIISVDYDDGRLFPLTENGPKCLLPVANRKLLAYQLDMLARSGVAETFIVAPAEYETHLSHFLAEYVRGRMNIDLVVVEEYSGSADAVRAVESRIRGDFFVVSSDFLSQFSFVDIAKLHRLQAADLTVFFAVPSKETVKDEIDKEYVAIDEDGRIYMKTPLLDLEDEELEIPKPLLNRAGAFSMRNDLMDMGVYLLSHWLLDVIVANPRLSSIRSDLLPFILERQFQSAEYFRDNLPALAKRNRPLGFLEPWLSAEQRPLSILETAANSIATQPKVEESFISANAEASISSTSGSSNQVDLLRCFGLIYDVSSLGSSSTAVNAPPSNSTILTRIVHIPSYLALNKEVPLMQFTSRSPWGRVSNFLKKESSVVGENVDVSDKTITFKQCSIGSNCKIGAKAKLNNCVIMDNVTIGDNCTIQNTVLSERVVIENNCNLNDCVVGAGYKVSANSKVKGEQLYNATS